MSRALFGVVPDLIEDETESMQAYFVGECGTALPCGIPAL
jgi:hypothetical protein